MRITRCCAVRPLRNLKSWPNRPTQWWSTSGKRRRLGYPDELQVDDGVAVDDPTIPRALSASSTMVHESRCWSRVAVAPSNSRCRGNELARTCLGPHWCELTRVDASRFPSRFVLTRSLSLSLSLSFSLRPSRSLTLGVAPDSFCNRVARRRIAGMRHRSHDSRTDGTALSRSRRNYLLWLSPAAIYRKVTRSIVRLRTYWIADAVLAVVVCMDITLWRHFRPCIWDEAKIQEMSSVVPDWSEVTALSYDLNLNERFEKRWKL